jgi:S-adenosylmethionine hydrolase
VDRFGNLISDIPGGALGEGAWVEIAGRRLRVVGTYAEAAPGECVALVSSFGTVEVAVRDGNAARLLAVGRGAPIRVLPGGAT